MNKWTIINGIASPFVIAIIWWLWKEGKKLAKKWYFNYREAENQFRKYQLEQNDLVMKELKEIKSQFYTNGGSTFKDDVIGIKSAIKNMDVRLDGITVEQRINREIMEVANWESDSEGKVTYVSTALCEIIGCTQIDLLHNSWIGFVSTEDRQRVVREWQESVQNASEYNCIYNFKRTDGTYQKVKAIAIHVKDEEGKVKETLGRITKIEEPLKK